MKKRKSILFLIFLFVVYKSSSQDFQITQLKLEFIDNQLIITYDIGGKNASGKYNVSIEIKRQDGKSIQPKAIAGDLGNNIKSGISKRIIWDLEKDSLYLDEDISVRLQGRKLSESYSRGSLLLMSTALPGLGQTKMTGKPWWIGGVVAYGTLAGGIIYHKKSSDSFDLYRDEQDPLTRDKLSNQMDRESNISTTLFITAASIWVANIIWVAVAPYNSQPLKHTRVYVTPIIEPFYQGSMISLRVDF